MTSTRVKPRALDCFIEGLMKSFIEGFVENFVEGLFKCPIEHLVD